MDVAQLLPIEIQQALDRGSTILTANQRAARTLRYAFDREQHARGRLNWQPPAIFAWDTWISMLWRSLLIEGRASALLLNRWQEHALWTDIIASERNASRSSSSLQPADALAETASKAWLLLHSYQGRHRLQAYADSVDTRTFERWATEFERLCARSNYLSVARLPDVLRIAATHGHLPPMPHSLLLIGFDSRTPAQSALLDAIRACGASVEDSQAPKAEPATLFAADDLHAELTAAARWLRAQLIQQPASRLAIIVPALAEERAEIDRVFRNILAPELDEIAAPAGTGPYEFSLGVPLASTPIVVSILDLLHWISGALAIDRITSLLLSPHFATGGTDVERLARAEFDAFVLRRRLMLQPELTLDRFLSLAAHAKSSPGLPVLLRHLRALRALMQKRDFIGGDRSHADWATVISDILEAAGMSVNGRDSSAEFQTRRKWESLLDEFVSLGFDNRRCSYQDAVTALQRIAMHTLFAPETRHAPVQIMGPLEAAGSRFDAIWFLHAGDLSWPAGASPNPLLSWRLQRDLRLPGAHPTQSAVLARDITARIAASAPTVVFSYAAQSLEGQRQRPSAALADLVLTSRTLGEIAPAAPTLGTIHLEVVDELEPIPVPPDRVLRGGAGILQAQAECGFRAFAEKRLFSTALEEVDLGLSPRERGELVHTALDRFWAEVQTQDALRQMSREEREQVLTRAIDHALAQQSASSEQGWPAAYINTERQRLLNLLGPWLQYELKRSPFSVKSRELMVNDSTIGPLRLSIRVDRIDLTADGGEIILDYKTGLAKPAAWLGDRPELPQIPLYAVLSQASNLAAVAFANIRAGDKMGIDGYEASPGILPKTSKLPTVSLDSQVDEWRVVLSKLAEAFHAGDASVLPRQYPTTCRRCQQRLLCRLDPASLSAAHLEEFELDFIVPSGESDLG